MVLITVRASAQGSVAASWSAAALRLQASSNPPIGFSPGMAGNGIARFGGIMTKAKRGSGSHRWVHLCAAAALGIALSGCGGGGNSGASGASGESGVSSAAATSPGADSAGNVDSSLPTASSGAVTLNWTPPTQNTDGTPLTNLSGYDIHYGTSSGNYTQTISVSNPGIATYVVDDLSPGTYYFSVTAVNSQGTESPLSSEVSTTVN